MSSVRKDKHNENQILKTDDEKLETIQKMRLA